MRILLANTRHFRQGGDSTYTFGLADLLRDAGHTVGFFAMAGDRNEPDPNEDLFVSHIDFRELNRRKSVASGLQVLRRSIFSSEAERKFTRLVERFTPDVVHLQNIHAHLTPSIVFAAARLGIPAVWTLHDYKLMCPNSHFRIDATGAICEQCRPGRYYPAVINRCKKGSLLASSTAAIEAYAHWTLRLRTRVHRFLAPSRFLAEKLLEHGWAPDRVRHVPNFVFPAAPRRRGPGSHFLFVGKLDLLKGIDVLLDAARSLEHVKFLLVGGCDDPAIGEQLARLPANLRYLGPKTKPEIEALLLDARALLAPSVWYENQPMVILEAFAAGVPVVGSRIGGIPELLGDDERGLLVAPGEAADLARAIAQLDREPALATVLGQHARDYVLRHHSAAQHLAAITQVYQEAGVPVSSSPAAASEPQASWI